MPYIARPKSKKVDAVVMGAIVFGIFYAIYGVYDTNATAHDMRIVFSLFMGAVGYAATYFG